MTKYPSQLQDKFNLRFPDGMRDAVAERAKQNGRSMNSEIIQILEDALNSNPVLIQSEFNIDIFKEQPSDDEKLTISRKQLMTAINSTVQEAINLAGKEIAISAADATLKTLSDKFDFVPKKNN